MASSVTLIEPQQNPTVPVDIALTIIRSALGCPVEDIPGDPDHRVARFGSEVEARRGVVRLRENSVSAEARQAEAGWDVVVDVRVSPPLVVPGMLDATLRFPAAQFIPGGPRRITLTSEPARDGAVMPRLILWVPLRSLRVRLVEAVVETDAYFLEHRDPDLRAEDGAVERERSLLQGPNQTSESMVIVDVPHEQSMRLCVRTCERVRVTLEAPELDSAAPGAYHVDVQLEGYLVRSSTELTAGADPGVGGVDRLPS